MAADARNLSKIADTPDRELVLTRTYDAPRELVFKAWTEPEHLKKWWGPNMFTTPVCEVDARTGGALRIHMRGPDGTVYPMTGKYLEVVPPERLIFTTTPLDADGKAMFEVLTTVIFEKQSNKTRLTLRAKVTMKTAQAAPYLAGMEMGWTQSLDRLAKAVEK